MQQNDLGQNELQQLCITGQRYLRTERGVVSHAHEDKESVAFAALGTMKSG